MQIAITGSGSALPDPFRGGASCAVIIDGRILQFDFGRQVMENLMLMGVSPMQIDEIYFTHLHFDHINDYDYYATASWLSGLQKEVPTPLSVLAAKANVKMLVPYHLPPYGSAPAAVEMSSLYYGRDTDASVWARFVEAIEKNYSGKVVLAQDRMILTVG